MDWSSVIFPVITSAVAALVAYLLGRKERNKKIDTSIIEDVQKITDIQKDILDNSEAYWKQRFEDHQKDCQLAKEKLRNDLGAVLVENATLKEKVSELNGYIQGVKETNPLIKLEADKKAALIGGRRETDKNKKENEI